MKVVNGFTLRYCGAIFHECREHIFLKAGGNVVRLASISLTLFESTRVLRFDSRPIYEAAVHSDEIEI